MKYIVSVFFFLFIFTSCSYENKYAKIVAHLESRNIKIFKNILIESRHFRNDTFIVYSFIIEKDTSSFTLPNFSKYDSTEISDPERFDVVKYGQYLGRPKPQEAWQYSKLYSDSIVSEFDRLHVAKISGRNEGIMFFYLEDATILLYAPNVTKIKNEYLRDIIKRSKIIKRNWYWIKEI